MVKTRSGLDSDDPETVPAYYKVLGDKQWRKTTKATKERHKRNRGTGRGPALPTCRVRQSTGGRVVSPRGQPAAAIPPLAAFGQPASGQPAFGQPGFGTFGAAAMRANAELAVASAKR